MREMEECVGERKRATGRERRGSGRETDEESMRKR